MGHSSVRPNPKTLEIFTHTKQPLCLFDFCSSSGRGEGRRAQAAGVKKYAYLSSLSTGAFTQRFKGTPFLTLHCKTWLVKIRSENHVEKIKIPPQEHSNQGTPVLYYTFRKPGQTQGKLIGIDGPL